MGLHYGYISRSVSSTCVTLISVHLASSEVMNLIIHYFITCLPPQIIVCLAFSAVMNLIIHHFTACLPRSTDCIQRQNKLEEFGVKYALQKREASTSNEIQSL